MEEKQGLFNQGLFILRKPAINAETKSTIIQLIGGNK